jgi:hypothetical protein
VVKTSSVVVTEEYPFTDFSQLSIGLFDVEVRQGEGYSVVLEMDRNLLDHVHVAKNGPTLRIGLDPSQGYRLNNIRRRAEITMPRLTELSMDLCNDGKISGFESGDNLVIDVSQSSLRGEVHAGDLEITAEVSSRVDLNGSAGDVTVKAAVDSDVDLGAFVCEDAVVQAEVSSQVTVHPTGRLDAEATASKVRYVGEPSLGQIKSGLGGSVEKR